MAIMEALAHCLAVDLVRQDDSHESSGERSGGGLTMRKPAKVPNPAQNRFRNAMTRCSIAGMPKASA